MVRRSELLIYISFSLVLSALLRVLWLGDANYWLDEMVSLHFAQHESWRALFWDNNPPFYHLLLKGWVAAFGEREAATRTLSVFFSVATTGVMMRVGYELRGKLGLLFFGILHAIWALSITYARETRMYAMFEFFSALNLLFFLRLEHKEDRLHGYFFSSFFMALSHYLAVVTLSVQAIYFLAARHVNRRVATLCFAGVTLVLVAFYFNFFKWDSLKWQEMKFSLEPASRWPTGLLLTLANYSWFCAAAIFLVVSLAVLLKRNEKINRQRLRLAMLIIVPLIGVFAISALVQRSASLPRYWIYLLPPLLTLVGLSFVDVLETVWSKAALFLFAVVLLSTALAMPKIYANKKEPWKSVVEMIQNYPNSLILTTRSLALKTPYFDSAGIDVQQWDPNKKEDLERLEDEVAVRKRVWIVENYYGGLYVPQLAIKLELEKRYRLVSTLMSVDESSSIRVLMIEEK